MYIFANTPCLPNKTSDQSNQSDLEFKHLTLFHTLKPNNGGSLHKLMYCVDLLLYGLRNNLSFLLRFFI